MKHRVIIRRCETYDPELIARIVAEGMRELGVKPEGRTMLNPNTVLAHEKFFPYAFTRKEFLDGVLTAVKAEAGQITRLSVGERCGITVPTRYAFSSAGYPAVLKKHGAEADYFDELPAVGVKLSEGRRLRDRIFVPRPVAECDFLVNLPKLKGHPWTRMTCSLKNYIGIQDDRHRLVDHNLWLEHKIADLQEVIQPRFIAVDGITAGQFMMLTPTPFHLGAIVMGTNSCAVDTVCAHMIHVDPLDVKHLVFSSERGFGPCDLSQIEVTGDFALDEVRERSQGFGICMEHIDDYFADEPNLGCTVGTFPEHHSRDYCWGGCPGALQEAIHIHKSFDPEVMARLKPIRYVVGEVDGPLDLRDDEYVIFAGSCTRWEGDIDGEHVKIEPMYRSPAHVDETRTRTNDMLLKMADSLARCFLMGDRRWIRTPGCPVSVAEHVNFLWYLGKIGNPNFNLELVVPYVANYMVMHVKNQLNR
jgi:uncharacterized protein (DUF362 family)